MSRRCHHGPRRHGRPAARHARPTAAPLPDDERRPPVTGLPGPIAERASEPVERDLVPRPSPPAIQPGPPAAPTQPAAGHVAGLDPVREPSGDRLGSTAPQLRRFIKSRAYVPMHELRRRFGINGADDEVTQVQLADRRIYVGLPSAEGRLLGELLRGGDVGYELSLDPISPIVVGVYPMRPIPRQ